MAHRRTVKNARPASKPRARVATKLRAFAGKVRGLFTAKTPENIAYGEKKDYRPISLFNVVKFKGRDELSYVTTTTLAKDTKEAVAHFWDDPAHVRLYAGDKIVARYKHLRKG